MQHGDSEATEGDPKYLAKELMQAIFTKSADIFSLGITILELACDLDLPSGGEGWHRLRDGNIPSDLYNGEHFFFKPFLQNKNKGLKMYCELTKFFASLFKKGFQHDGKNSNMKSVIYYF